MSSESSESSGSSGSLQLSGPWSQDECLAFLDRQVIPLRVATNGRSGPLVQSMWFTREGTSLLCSTQRSAVITRRVRRDPVVGYEVAADSPPYRGVRGQALVGIHDPGRPDVLERLLVTYDDPSSSLAHWLRSRADGEVTLELSLRSMRSYDYSRRM